MFENKDKAMKIGKIRRNITFSYKFVYLKLKYNYLSVNQSGNWRLMLIERNTIILC